MKKIGKRDKAREENEKGRRKEDIRMWRQVSTPAEKKKKKTCRHQTIRDVLITYVINILVIICNVIEQDLVVVSRAEGVCLVDFGCEKEGGDSC